MLLKLYANAPTQVKNLNGWSRLHFSCNRIRVLSSWMRLRSKIFRIRSTACKKRKKNIGGNGCKLSRFRRAFCDFLHQVLYCRVVIAHIELKQCSRDPDPSPSNHFWGNVAFPQTPLPNFNSINLFAVGPAAPLNIYYCSVISLYA